MRGDCGGEEREREREGGKGRGFLAHGVSENKLCEESQTFQRERERERESPFFLLTHLHKALFPFPLILLVCGVEMSRISGCKTRKGNSFHCAQAKNKKGKLILEVISRDLPQHHGRVKTTWLKGAALSAVMASRSSGEDFREGAKSREKTF